MDTLTRLGKTLWHALGLKRLTIIAAASGFVSLYGALNTRLTWLPDIPSWVLVLAFLGWFLFFVVLTHAAKLEQRLTTKLAIGVNIDATHSRYEHGLGMVSIGARFIHVVVSTDSDDEIEDCRVSLTAAERDGVAAPFRNPIKLVTASEHEQSATIRNGVPQPFDLMSTMAGSPLDLAPGLHKLNLIGDFFHHPGTYTLTVVATGKGTRHLTRKIAVSWDGAFDSVKASVLPA